MVMNRQSVGFHSYWLGLIQRCTCCIIGLHLALCSYTDKRESHVSPTSSVMYVHLLASVLPPCGMTQSALFKAHDIN